LSVPTSPQRSTLGAMDDLVISSFFGLAVGGTLLALLQRYPGKPFRYDNMSEEEAKKTEDENETATESSEGSKKKKEYSVNEALEAMTEESVIKKTTKLRKVLGIDEEIIRKAVRKTKEEARTGAMVGDEVSIMRITDWVVFLVIIFGALYFVNVVSNGQVYRVFHGLFPAEFETLNLPRPT
jgi:Fe2+ transport system protein B